MKKLRFPYNLLIKYGSILIFSLLYLLVFSLWTTPLYKNWYGCDASFFTMAGRGITKGWVPYRDFFDLKGPCFFFIEAIGQFICNGRTGAFIMQVIALFATLVIMIKLCRMFISKGKTIFILSIFLIFHIATLWGGNTLEEYMLPLSLLCIYLVFKDLRTSLISDSASVPSSDAADSPAILDFQGVHPSTALITGICFSIILFAKITVAAPIIGLVLAVLIFYIKNKQFKGLIEYLLFALLGLLIPTTLLFIYFACKDCLYDMLYSVFVFAFKRGTDIGQKYNLRWELKISGCYFALVFVLCQIVRPFSKKSDDIMDSNNDEVSQSNELHTPKGYPFFLTAIACIASVTAVAMHFGDPFIYYFTTVYPALILAFIAIFIKYNPFTLLANWRLDVPIAFFLVTLCYFASHTANTLNTVIYDRGNTYYEDYASNAEEMASLIPTIERDSVYSINMDMQWFEITGILPCYSYTINLQYFVALDPRIQDKIINRLETTPPKWIVVGGDLAGYLPILNDAVTPKYTNIYENSYGALYLLNEAN